MKSREMLVTYRVYQRSDGQFDIAALVREILKDSIKLVVPYARCPGCTLDTFAGLADAKLAARLSHRNSRGHVVGGIFVGDHEEVIRLKSQIGDHLSHTRSVLVSEAMEDRQWSLPFSGITYKEIDFELKSSVDGVGIWDGLSLAAELIDKAIQLLIPINFACAKCIEDVLWDVVFQMWGELRLDVNPSGYIKSGIYFHDELEGDPRAAMEKHVADQMPRAFELAQEAREVRGQPCDLHVSQQVCEQSAIASCHLSIVANNAD